MRFSVIIPAYNEEARLPATLRKIDDYLQKQDYSYEILVVDDGSVDKTFQTTQKLTGIIKNLKLIRFEKNKGKGYAVRLGMLQAKGDYCLFVDADNSVSIEQLENFWPELDRGADMVIASRDVKGAVLNPAQGWARRVILGGSYKKARRMLLGMRDIEDTQCGFKCFKKEAIRKIFSRCQINGLAFDTEVLFVARRMGFIIKEVPVCWRNNSSSRVTAKLIAEAALDLLRIKMRAGKYALSQPRSPSGRLF